jgi:hypothetical protein
MVEAFAAYVKGNQMPLPSTVFLEQIPLMLHRSRRDGGMRRIPAL